MPIITYLDNDGNVQTAQTNHRYSATIDQDYNLGDTDIRPGDTLIEFSFYGRDFPNADFSGITFRGCNFKSSNFSNANFNDCAFYGTNKYTEITLNSLTQGILTDRIHEILLNSGIKNHLINFGDLGVEPTHERRVGSPLRLRR